MNFKQHLEKLKIKALALLEHGQEVKTEDKNTSGRNNQLQFRKTNNPQIRFVFTKSKRPPLILDRIAISTPRKEQEAKANVVRISKTQSIMHEEKIVSPHIHPSMYVGSDGIKVSPAAISDLVDKVNQEVAQKKSGKIFTFYQLQRIFGQIILGTDAFHQKNIAFRDLKSDNFLIFETVNEKGEIEYLVKICDHDGITKVDAQTKQLADPNETMVNSLEFFPPEGYSTLYHQMDLLKADSYACGIVLEKLLPFTQMTPQQERVANQLVFKLKNWRRSEKDTTEIWTGISSITNRPIPGPNLAGKREYFHQQLQRHFSPNKRISVADAKKDLFFSTENATAEQFFEQLEADFSHTVHIDDVTINPCPKVDDPTNLLPPEIKTIYDELAALDKEKKPTLSAFNSLFVKVNTALGNKKLEHFHDDLEAIKTDLTSQINGLNDKINKLQGEINQLKIKTQELQSKKQELQSKKTLLDAIENAVKEFITSNNLSVRRTVIGTQTKQNSATRFIDQHSDLNLNNTNYASYEKFLFFPNPFARHGQEGLKRITALYEDLKKSSTNANLTEMHKKIQTYLSSKEGNWNNHSTKTLIMRNIPVAFTKAYSQWQKHIPPQADAVKHAVVARP